MPTDNSTSEASTPKAVPAVRFAANEVRLSPRQWLVAAALIALAGWLVPFAWEMIKPLTVGPDYRLPYRLGHDYWSYERMCQQTGEDDPVLLVGDSVLWGHYVDCDETLSHYLSQGANQDRFANRAVDGIHPVSLAGLVRHFGTAIRDKRVVINCNLLWISSPRHDLTTDKEAPFNHPELVPQFTTRIPCYNASISDRLGIVISRHIGIFSFADHLRSAYYDSDDLATWTIDHPYENPWGPLRLDLPPPNEPPSPTPDVRPWFEKAVRPLTPDWVPLDQSLQWEFFCTTVELLELRGNQVFVLINPLNEHMLTEDGTEEYKQLRQRIVNWHAERGVPYFAPPALPTEMYADLSHPVANGYDQLAESMWEDERFRSFMRQR